MWSCCPTIACEMNVCILLQGVARFYKAKKNHIVTVQTVSSNDNNQLM